MSGHCKFCEGRLIVLHKKEEIEEFLEERIRVDATYLGGHKKYFDKEDGVLILIKDELIFRSDKIEFRIPLSRINVNKLTSSSKKGLVFSLLVGILESFISKTFLKIPFSNKNGIEHEPEFKVKGDVNKFSELLYNTIIERRKKV